VADVVAIKVRADAKQAKGELKDLGGVFAKLDRAMKNPVTQFAAVAAGIAAVGAAAVAAGVVVVKTAADVAVLGDEIAKTARIVGVSAEEFQVLRFAAERSGVSMRSVSSGMKKLSKSLFEASTVGGTMSDTFEGMGIAFEDGNGNLRDSFDVLKDIADRMKRVGVTSRTTAEAQIVLGRAGTDLTNLLIEGSISLEEYEARLRAIGGLMSAELLASSERFQDSLTDLDFAFLGLKASITESVLPGLTDFVDFTTNVLIPELKDLAEVTKTVGADIFEDLRPALEMIGDMLTGRGFGSTRRMLDTLKVIRDIGVPDDPPPPPPPPPPGGGDAAVAGTAGELKRREEEWAAFTAGRLETFNQTNAALLDSDIQRLNAEIEAERLHVEELARLDAERFAQAERDAEREIALAKRVARDKIAAANAAFSAVETFAGIAQGAVEDSYFGQTRAGRTAAKALFIAGKASALASAIVNTAQAISASASIGYPAAIPGVAAAGITGGAAISTIIATTIQGLADAGLAPGALRDAGLHGHTAIAISPGEAVIDPVGTAEISRMLALQRRQMEMAAQGGANGGPIVVVAELDGRRVSRGLSGPMTADLEDGHDFRRNTRMEVG